MAQVEILDPALSFLLVVSLLQGFSFGFSSGSHSQCALYSFRTTLCFAKQNKWKIQTYLFLVGCSLGMDSTDHPGGSSVLKTQGFLQRHFVPRK